jgi:hypothetical protein
MLIRDVANTVLERNPTKLEPEKDEAAPNLDDFGEDAF